MGKQNKNSFRLESTEKKNIFYVPEGYFLSLAGNIKRKIPERNQVLNRSVYKVPEGYFKKLHIAVSQRISQVHFLDNPVLKRNIFQVSDDYFVSSENKIILKVQTGVVHKPDEFYTVPEGYFETLESKIQNKIHSKGKVIRQDFHENTLWKYAIAASVTLLLTGSALFYFMSQPLDTQMVVTNIPEVELLIASLEKPDIQQYLEKHENIENQDIVEFSSQQKLARITRDFDKQLFPATLGDKEKENLELELEDIDISELPSDI